MKSELVRSVLGFMIFVFLLITSVGLVYLLYLFIFAGLDKTVQSTIIAAIGTVFASVVAVIYNQRKTKEREIAESHRPQKMEIYKNFMIMMFDFLQKAKVNTNDENNFKKLEEGFVSFTRELIIWGSPGVIKAFSIFRNSANLQQKNQILIYFDKILLEMRLDLGNSNKNIKNGDLIKLLLTNPEELDSLLLN